MKGVFKADESPQLARSGLPRPQGYQALNNILQPIREKMLPLTQYADSLAEWEPVFFSLNNVIGGLNAGIEKMMLNY